MRLNTSSEEFAWIVDSEPSLPWLIALSIVTISSPSTSPTMTRLGFMRSDRRTSSDIWIAPWPSELGSRSSNATTFGCRSGNSPEPELERALDGDEPLVRRDLVGQRAQQRRLSGVGGAGDHDVLARGDGRGQEAGELGGHRAVLDEHVQARRAGCAPDGSTATAAGVTPMTADRRLPSGRRRSSCGLAVSNGRLVRPE